jgi:peptide/nickel transport system permease protein
MIGAGATIALLLSFVPDRSIDLTVWERFLANLHTLVLLEPPVERTGPAISALLWDRSINSLVLIGGAIAMIAGIGVPVGLARALLPESQALTMFAALIHVLSSIPILVWAFALLMASGAVFEIYPDFTNLADAGRFETILIYGVPIAALGLGDGLLSDIVRNVRSESRRELSEPYYRALLMRKASVLKHLGRGVVAPVASVLSSKIAYLVSGTIVVEYIFNVTGLARQIYVSVEGTKDYPMVLAATMLFVAITVSLNVLVKLVALSADPRLRNS